MDKDAQFKTVIEANRDRIYRICCCYVRGETERQDVCQEVLVHIWRSLPEFQGRSELSTWVYRITVNTCLDHLRVAQRRDRLIDRRAAADACASAAVASEQDPTRTDDVRHLYACIRRLPLVEKTLIALYLDDVTTREMAAILGISEGNVRVKLHRTKQRLKSL